MLEASWIPNRGVVRRLPQPSGFGTGFLYPRLHQSFTATDHVLVLKHAIAGELIGCSQVSYINIRHDKQISTQHLRNRQVFDSENLMIATADSYAQKFNLAYSYVRNPRQFSERMANNAKELLRRRLRKRENNEPEIDCEFYKRIQQHRRVAILGAGIQGTLMALMFKKHGFDVTLIDRASDIMDRTSTTGEGRIHMGLEYANDPSMDTATYMLESAMRFAHYTEYLVNDKLDWNQLKSERLICLLPHTSHVTPHQFEEYGNKLGKIYENILLENPELTYLGERPPKVLLGATEIPKAVNASYVTAAYQSIEVCILSNKLRDIIRQALRELGVTMIFDRTIQGVKRNDEEDAKKYGKLRVISDLGEHDYDVVVNCLWENRAMIDRQMGLGNNEKDESYRVKANVRLVNIPELHGNIPSVSVMNGPFGDFVRYGPDDKIYFAWHPMSPTVITHNLTEAEEHFHRHVISDFPPGFERHTIEGHRNAFEQLFPGFDSSFFNDGIVGTGYVVANGLTDIGDPKSGLHVRRDPPNLVKDGYISVKTQKLTNAPYNTYLLEQELFQRNVLAQ